MDREEFGVGSALGRGFAIVFRNLPAFLLIGLVTFAPLFAYAATRDLYTMSVQDVMTTVLVLIGGAVVLQTLLTAAITFGVVEQMAGRPAGVGTCIRVGLGRMIPTIGLFVVLAVLFGLVGFVSAIPFALSSLIGAVTFSVAILMLYCTTFVAVPALVIERDGIGSAITRSAALTRGYRWQIFGVVFLLGVFLKIANWVLEKALVPTDRVITSDEWRMLLLVTVGLFMLSSLLMSTISAVSYVMMRNTKDGVGVGELAKVFE